MKDAFIFLTRSPETAPRILKKFQLAARDADQDFDFHICTYEESSAQKHTKIELNGELIDHWVFGKQDAISLGYSPKVTTEDWVFIPGNVDVLILKFFQLHKDYDRYWQVEDDVDYSGDVSELINSLSEYNDDLICTHVQRGWKTWTYAHRLKTGEGYRDLSSEETLLCFLPFYSVTRAGLLEIDRAYSAGWTGHPEQTWATIIQETGLSIRDIGGTGEFVAPEDRNRFYFGLATNIGNKTGSFIPTPPRLFVGKEPDTLWHPVKPFDQWFSGKVRRLRSIFTYYKQRIDK